MNFYKSLEVATVEREVEYAYNKELLKYFKDTNIEHPYQCDGLIDTTINSKHCKLLIEYKYDEDLLSSIAQSKVIIQILFYLKQFSDHGDILPNVCMVADKNECFIFHSNNLLKYFDEDVDWNTAPSVAYRIYPNLLLKISQELNQVAPFVFKIDADFNFDTLYNNICNLAEDVQQKTLINEHNIDKLFGLFSERIIKSANKIGSHDLVSIFIGCIINKENYYLHPTKKNILITPSAEINVNSKEYNAFFSQFSNEYTIKQKREISAIADRLIEDKDRRNSGDFWTPTPFVDYAHKMISEQLGEDWKDEYIVWDNCCGSKNLTRDYKFKELYCSTLFDSELEIGSKYNKEATTFQFDFLNDPEDKLPEGLLNAFKENKKIVFFLNPPYATGGAYGNNDKIGVNDTSVRKQMRADNLGGGAENIQHQFLYRICQITERYHLTNCNIALFSNPIFLSGGKQANFLKYLCSNFEYKNGILFQASNFANVSGSWGITFNIWKSGKTIDIHNFIHTLIAKNNEEELVKIGEKNIYNVWDSKSMNIWVKEPLKGISEKPIELPNVTNALSIKEENTKSKMLKDAICYFLNGANAIRNNNSFVGLFSSPYASEHGISCMPQNFLRVTPAFSARKLIIGDWTDAKDEYLAPNENHPNYKQFELDSVIYCLFNGCQSSLRNVEYKGKKYDIKNEFFWMPVDRIKELAEANNNEDCYEDCSSEERYVYKFIAEHESEFSDKAKAVLSEAIKLVEDSFPFRSLFNVDHPEYQINNWDASWYQIKGMLKEYMPDRLKEFNKLYKEFADELRPMVYELGFLRK